MSYSFFKNEIITSDRAQLHVSDLSIQRGYGIFDFFRVFNNRPLYIEHYISRFYNSASIMHLQVPCDPAELRSIIDRLIEKNDLPDSGVKMILTGGYSADGYKIGKPNLIITQDLFTPPPAEQINKGIKIITHEYRRDLPEAKTINYSMGIWLAERIEKQQASDVLYHIQNEVTEFPRCNFFLVKDDGTVATPGNGVLQGVTRLNIIKLAARKYETKVGPITLQDIRNAREAFLTSTTKRIVPIVRVDDFEIGNGKPGDVSLSLLSDLIELEKVQIPEKV